MYDFIDGHKDLKGLLGGKGANLAEMTRMGLDVPAEAFEAERAGFGEGELDAARLRDLVQSYQKVFQTHTGRPFPQAQVIAAQLVEEGVITRDEALRRVTGEQLAQLMLPSFDEQATPPPLTTGVPASPGAAVGAVVFDSAAAPAATEPVILVRRETNPDDLPGMIAAAGILTARGGKTSHAAVVARGMGRTCVCGADQVEIGTDSCTVAGHRLRAGDVISIDGANGRVYAGAVPVRPSKVVRFSEGEIMPCGNALLRAVQQLMAHADQVARLEVHANADTGADAARARRFGATGIGLCRLPLQQADFEQLFAAMDGLPVTIRLIDPPLHGGDPASVRFFHDAGLDHVSCSPFRVPVARLEAGRAAVTGSDTR
ncbi:hypothetical protein Asi03nite_02440 [Actinoplanes siamensis]|uniref:Pyruvate, phosphate dikinase n=1 Tax=Actinoplanes siamensis TaxID=1223317 RepID=A0A919K833_9ACTN|nr:hypothetical protein Asi03nite_02440 [Actinoplanes siamensis]